MLQGKSHRTSTAGQEQTIDYDSILGINQPAGLSERCKKLAIPCFPGVKMKAITTAIWRKVLKPSIVLTPVSPPRMQMHFDDLSNLRR